jgi:Protein of unknown function (DUF3182)
VPQDAHIGDRSLDPIAACRVVYLAEPEGQHPATHRYLSGLALARRIAGLKRCEFAGPYDVSISLAKPLYFVTNETLIGRNRARQLGIESENDLFGGVAPYGFVATKSISHPLIGNAAAVPVGWSKDFADEVSNAVLVGFSSFGLADAHRAALSLLGRGPFRLKPGAAEGGLEQVVVSRAADLEAAIDGLKQEEIERCGVVLEEDLVDTITCSVGRVKVGDLLATYCGTQQLTRNNAGATAYGGSTLFVVRGDFEDLLAADIAPNDRLAVVQARLYDRAAFRHFSGLIASRRNYDVVQGLDVDGQRRSAVLEQSWRLGGSTGAEVVALEAFAAEPRLKAVRAACVEAYGKNPVVPGDALIYFHGDDPGVGPLTKYARVEARHHAL